MNKPRVVAEREPVQKKCTATQGMLEAIAYVEIEIENLNQKLKKNHPLSPRDIHSHIIIHSAHRLLMEYSDRSPQNAIEELLAMDDHCHQISEYLKKNGNTHLAEQYADESEYYIKAAAIVQSRMQQGTQGSEEVKGVNGSLIETIIEERGRIGTPEMIALLECRRARTLASLASVGLSEGQIRYYNSEIKNTKTVRRLLSAMLTRRTISSWNDIHSFIAHNLDRFDKDDLHTLLNFMNEVKRERFILNKLESWMDEEREAGYGKQVGLFRKSMQRNESAGRRLLTVLAVSISKIGEKTGEHEDSPDPRTLHARIIKEDLVQSFSEEELARQFSFAIHEFTSAQLVAGRIIQRPIFVHSEAMNEKLQKFIATEGIGFFMSGSFFPGVPLWQDTGIIVSTDKPEAIDHEMRHSIEPFLRTGYDRLLSELFAYYDFYINSPGIVNMVGSENYYENYSAQASQRISQEEWSVLVRKCVDKARKLRVQFGDIRTQRMIICAKTVKDFLSLAEY